MSTPRGAAALLDAVGLLADGPLVWGARLPERRPGVYVVELAAPLPAAPIELTRVGKWLERVDTLRLDGARPTSKAVLARLAAFWLPGDSVVYVGMTTASLGSRVAAFVGHVLGDRRPHAGGHWLKTLRGLERCRVWWSATEAAEEYEDALLSAFAERVPAAERAALHDRAVVLPFANLRTATGERKAHGISGSVLPDESAPAPAGRVVELPPGDADGAHGAARATRSTGRAVVRGERATRRVSAGAARPSRATPVDLTAAALERMRAELDDLTRRGRPEVVARVKAARELGDLRENAEYHAAREEHSFLEGRVRTLEERIRNARIIEQAVPGAPLVGLGSTVTVEHDGDVATYTVVGSTEADPASGRISAASPVGAALLGRAVGDAVEVRTPRGLARYRIIRLG